MDESKGKQSTQHQPKVNIVMSKARFTIDVCTHLLTWFYSTKSYSIYNWSAQHAKVFHL